MDWLFPSLNGVQSNFWLWNRWIDLRFHLQNRTSPRPQPEVWVIRNDAHGANRPGLASWAMPRQSTSILTFYNLNRNADKCVVPPHASCSIPALLMGQLRVKLHLHLQFFCYIPSITDTHSEPGGAGPLAVLHLAPTLAQPWGSEGPGRVILVRSSKYVC